MAIKESDIENIRKRIIDSERPLFLYDDDPDGLVSFLLLYRMRGLGKGLMVKSSPELKESYADKVDEYQPDLIIILDKPMVSDGFLKRIKVPIIWIDHHAPQEPRTANYYNPRIEDDKDNSPTSYQAYRIAQDDIWLAMVGCVSDWHLPSFTNEFINKFPDLLTSEYDTPPKALFDSPLGVLCKAFSFMLKGRTSEINKLIKIMSRIENPYEVLKQNTPRGKLVYKYYENMNQEYLKIFNTIDTNDEKIIIYFYDDDKISFTSDLSNELLHKFPEKVIMVGRKKDDLYKMSLRSTQHDLPIILNKSLVGIDGYGGGHKNACGCVVNENDFEKFLDKFKGFI